MISSLTYDATRYRFTDAAAPAPVIESPADVTGSFSDVAKQKKHGFKVKVHLDSDKLPAGKVLGNRLAWKRPSTARRRSPRRSSSTTTTCG